MAWLAPVLGLLGTGLGIISTNANNKAAIKNNDTQQATLNAQQAAAWQGANKTMAPWLNPANAPFAGSSGSVARPSPVNAPQQAAQPPRQPQQINASSLMAGQPQQPPAPPQIPPALMQEIMRRIMARQTQPVARNPQAQ